MPSVQGWSGGSRCTRSASLFACQLRNAGVDLGTWQERLGHDSITITQRYAQLSDRTRRAEYFQAITQVEREMHHEPTAADQLSPLLRSTEFLG